MGLCGWTVFSSHSLHVSTYKCGYSHQMKQVGSACLAWLSDLSELWHPCGQVQGHQRGIRLHAIPSAPNWWSGHTVMLDTSCSCSRDYLGEVVSADHDQPQWQEMVRGLGLMEASRQPCSVWVVSLLGGRPGWAAILAWLSQQIWGCGLTIN